MKTQTNSKLKKGFTIAEMTATIAIFALVAAMAIGFVTTMSKFTKQNTRDVEQLQLQWMLRIEMDKWFSAMDSVGAELCFDKEALEENQLVTATVDEQKYTVRFCNSGSAGSTAFDAVEFTYPDNFGVEGEKVLVKTELITDIVFTQYGVTPSTAEPESNASSNGVFSFEITLHCKQQSLCCQVFYNKDYK